MSPKEPDAQESREKTLQLLALSGPIILLMSTAAMTLIPLNQSMWLVVAAMSLLSLALALAGAVACIAWLVNQKNRGRPKFRWMLLGLLDLLLVFPVLFYVVTGGR